MKFFSLLALFALMSCGDTTQNPNAVGDVVTLQPEALSADQVGQLNIICAAINSKTSRLENDSRTFSFDYTQRSCAATAATTTPIIATIASATNSSGELTFSFAVDGSKPYVFKEPETANSGVIRSICQMLSTPTSTPTNPLLQDNTGKKALWFQTVSNSECSPDTNSLCLQLLYGSSDDGISFTRHTREILKIKVLSGDKNRGFFTYRSRVSQVGCDAKESALYATELK